LPPRETMDFDVVIAAAGLAGLAAGSAIGTSRQGSYLLVVGKDAIVEQHPVKTGPLEENGLRVIEARIGAEDLVVAGGTQISRS